MAETLPAPSNTGPALDVGQSVGDTYELVRVIGRGGMGEVWAARHRRLPGKLVAIKVLHTGGKDLTQEALARFRREAEIASRIGHPNIVQVLDFNTLPSGAPYLVLELLQGESLASKLRFGPLSVDEAVSIARQTGSALKAAHAQGIVHRDLKPDNIFLVATPMGTMVKVLDFGISKVRDSTTVQTQEAVLLGTPQYMSPEQAIGANKDVGPQSDVFALGAITYEMLVGVPPFQAESVAKVVFEIAYQPHTPLAQRKADLPPRVVQSVEKALLKDRAHRFGDIGEFVAELSGKPLEDSGVLKLPEPAVGAGGVATPSMQPGGALDATAMKALPPPDGARVVDTKSKGSSSSSSGAGAMVYASGNTSSSGSRKWVAYVVAAGLMVGIGGTAMLAQRVGGGRFDAPVPLDKVASASKGDGDGKSAHVSPSMGISPQAPPPPPLDGPKAKVAATEPRENFGGNVGNGDTHPAARPEPLTAAAPAKAQPHEMPKPEAFASGEELEVLKKVMQLTPKQIADDERALTQLTSPRARQYLIAVFARAECEMHDQTHAPSHYGALTDPALRAAVKSFCAPRIGVEMMK